MRTHLVLLVCILAGSCASMREQASVTLLGVPSPQLQEFTLRPIAEDQLLSAMPSDYSEYSNCARDASTDECAPIMGDPTPALIEDAQCMLNILKTTTGIENIRTGLSLWNNLEIQFSYATSSGSSNTIRYEVVRVRDSFSY